jgi:hypothetical protein
VKTKLTNIYAITKGGKKGGAFMTTPNTGTLATLRALATTTPTSITDLRHTAKRQARLLRSLLAGKTPLLTRLVELIPSLRIEILDRMPVDSTAFWGNHHWHIHIHAGGLPSFYHFAALHELKHIIDHPLRQRLTTFTDTDWETVADYFAAQVLQPQTTANTNRERRNAYEPIR